MQVSSCFWQTVLWIEGGDAAGVVGEDQNVAVVTAAVVLQGASISWKNREVSHQV